MGTLAAGYVQFANQISNLHSTVPPGPSPLRLRCVEHQFNLCLVHEKLSRCREPPRHERQRVVKLPRPMLQAVLRKVSSFLGAQNDADRVPITVLHLNLVVYAMSFWMSQPVLPFITKGGCGTTSPVVFETLVFGHRVRVVCAWLSPRSQT